MRRLFRGRLGQAGADDGTGGGTIRARLAGAVTLALLPVLVLGAIQSALSFRAEAQDQRVALQGAAQRSVASAKARMAASSILLETLAPAVIQLDCAQRLASVRERVQGYANLIRFDGAGRVACSAASVPADPQRGERPWFRAAAKSDEVTVTTAPGGPAYASEPALLASIAAGERGHVLTAVITLSSLRPETQDRGLPPDSEVALVDGRGRVLTVTDPKAFPTIPADWLARSRGAQGATITATGAKDGERVYSIAPLLGDVYVVLSAPSGGLWSRNWLDPLSGLLFPLLAFSVTLIAVFIAADRAVLQWIGYLQRIADLYARGRFSVRPVQAESAPAEIRVLAGTLDEMAGAIVARDTTLQDNLAQKDDLLREIHHRVKNNLQVISSLLSMQERALTDPGARQAINDTRQRITALALIYRALYQGADLRHADLGPFLEELSAQLLMSETAQGTVKLEVHAEPLIIDPDKLAPVALFAVEAITNAQKHGLANRGGNLTVTFRIDGPEAILDIADDGGGQRPPADALEAKGVGRTLMNAFARQLRGRSEMAVNPEGGLTVTLVFPTPEAQA